MFYLAKLESNYFVYVGEVLGAISGTESAVREKLLSAGLPQTEVTEMFEEIADLECSDGKRSAALSTIAGVA